jgi:hypothetical protein
MVLFMTGRCLVGQVRGVGLEWLTAHDGDKEGVNLLPLDGSLVLFGLVHLHFHLHGPSCSDSQGLHLRSG